MAKQFCREDLVSALWWQKYIDMRSSVAYLMSHYGRPQVCIYICVDSQWQYGDIGCQEAFGGKVTLIIEAIMCLNNWDEVWLVVSLLYQWRRWRVVFLKLGQ